MGGNRSVSDGNEICQMLPLPHLNRTNPYRFGEGRILLRHSTETKNGGQHLCIGIPQGRALLGPGDEEIRARVSESHRHASGRRASEPGRRPRQGGAIQDARVQ